MRTTNVEEILKTKTLDPDDRYVEIASLGKKIREGREKCNMSRIKAAGYCGVADITFQRWEEGATKKIKQRYYKKLEQILNGTANQDNG